MAYPTFDRGPWIIQSRRIPTAVWNGKDWVFPPFDYKDTTIATYDTEGAVLEAIGMAAIDSMDPIAVRHV